MDFRLPPLLQATSGAVGSVVGKSIVFPLDSAVTRIQHAKSGTNTHKLSIISTLYRITRRRGARALYAGFGAETLSTLLSSFIYFYLYSSLHKLALRRQPPRPTPMSSPAGIGGMTSTQTHAGHSSRTQKPVTSHPPKLGAVEELVIGLVSGIVSKGVVLPVSAVCVRQQLHDGDDDQQQQQQQQAGVWSTLRQIHRQEGVLGLWSALPPSIPLALLPSLTLYIHTILLRLLVPARHRAHPPGGVTFAIGAASNALATIPLYPMVLIKVLSQSGSSKGRQIDTLRRIVYERGVRGLYQGIEGQLIKGVVQQGVMMLLKQRIEEGIIRAYRATT